MIEDVRDGDKRRTIRDKIDTLRESPLQRGKKLRGKLKGAFSTPAAGRYRIVYLVGAKGRNTDADPPGDVEGTVIVIGVGIRREGSRKDIYEIMGKLIDREIEREQ